MAKDHGSSIKDDEKYEKLRDQGASKEKAARIANASSNEGSSTVGSRGGKAGSYDDWSVDDLRERAKELDIEGRSSMSKDDLIEALRNH
jgi:activator of HSP90 ATPase